MAIVGNHRSIKQEDLQIDYFVLTGATLKLWLLQHQGRHICQSVVLTGMSQTNNKFSASII